MSKEALDFRYLREQIVGVDSTIHTPFGERLMVYCDYTASGRCLHFVESYLQGLQRIYANTHTEDDITGRSMTRLLHEAEARIKAAVNAGPKGRIVSCGAGATGAIDKFQQIVGVALAPATRENLAALVRRRYGDGGLDELGEFVKRHRPVVFVGPYEHHSNEISWREGLATVVKVDLDAQGGIDLEHLEKLLRDPAWRNRLRIGSFSAASNVTGMRSDVHAIASLLHRHDALACFDYAACAPYVEIDMNPESEDPADDPSLDAIFVSPHKFLGGPGSCGILVFNERVYHRDLPPSVAAGGTVDYVGPEDHDFVAGVEEREKAGTPGVLQTLKAALAFEIKGRAGIERIEARERELTGRALESWRNEPNIEILGNPDPERRVGIISFNLKDPRGGYLHPKFATVLLNDLFGIQTRAGCSCAGPYGHCLLNIDHATSERYRRAIARGFVGIKPGWCRVSLHYVMDDMETDYVIEAVRFAGEQGYRFLQLYDFDLRSGSWSHRLTEEKLEKFSLDAALASRIGAPAALEARERKSLYERYIAEAQGLARDLETGAAAPLSTLEGELGELQFFTLPAKNPPDR